MALLVVAIDRFACTIFTLMYLVEVTGHPIKLTKMLRWIIYRGVDMVSVILPSPLRIMRHTSQIVQDTSHTIHSE